MRVLAVTSGKGGVGKTSLVCNLAACLGRLGERVLVIDADVGLANADILMGVVPGATLEHLLRGEASLDDVLIDGPQNVSLLPSASGVQELTRLDEAQILFMVDQLDPIADRFDVVLVDTGAGIGDNVLTFTAAAQQALVVVTPEPTALTDAYAIMKVLRQKRALKRFSLLVNQVADEAAAVEVYGRLSAVADRFLDIDIEYLGHVVRDPALPRSVTERRLLVESAPESPAARCVQRLAETLLRRGPAARVTGNMQLFWRRLLDAEAGEGLSLAAGGV